MFDSPHADSFSLTAHMEHQTRLSSTVCFTVRRYVFYGPSLCLNGPSVCLLRFVALYFTVRRYVLRFVALYFTVRRFVLTVRRYEHFDDDGHWICMSKSEHLEHLMFIAKHFMWMSSCAVCKHRTFVWLSVVHHYALYNCYKRLAYISL